MHTVTTFVDDIDGSDAESTVRFSIGNDAYEIDLSSHNEDKLRKALAPYIQHGRAVKQSQEPHAERISKATGSRQALSRGESKKIRKWAKENNLPVNERGRISSTIISQYEAAHEPTGTP
ncbi:Lsr2 family protein [Nonomuraea sp. NPDC050663]|uniref:Lsr2 family protein n=1 Tax=Nonomuraea sp. NPDC050663 TaxID=3364370 RepID=UPI0037AFE560